MYKCLNRSQSGSTINYRHLCDDVSSAIFECSLNHSCIHGCWKEIGFTRLISRKRARNRRDRCRYRCNVLSRANITLLVTQTNSRFYPNLPILNSITKSTLEMSVCHSTHVWFIVWNRGLMCNQRKGFSLCDWKIMVEWLYYTYFAQICNWHLQIIPPFKIASQFSLRNRVFLTS